MNAFFSAYSHIHAHEIRVKLVRLLTGEGGEEKRM